MHFLIVLYIIISGLALAGGWFYLFYTLAKALRDLLLSVQDKPMEEQRTIIDSAFETWRGDNEQIDDVCMIGVRI